MKKIMPLGRQKFLIICAVAACVALFCPALASATSSILGTAGNFAVLGGSTVTNSGTTNITGNLGVSPGSSITGSPNVIGTTHTNDAVAIQAQVDNTTAYTALAAMPFNYNLTGQNLGGLTLTSGVYHFSSSAFLTGTLTLDAQGNNNAFWVFQIGSTLITASSSAVQVINPVQITVQMMACSGRSSAPRLSVPALRSKGIFWRSPALPWTPAQQLRTVEPWRKQAR